MISHQRGDRLRPDHNWQPALPRRHKFWVVLPDSRGNDDRHLVVWQIGGIVPKEHVRTKLAQQTDACRLNRVRAGHRNTAAQQQACDATHSRTTDPD